MVKITNFTASPTDNSPYGYIKGVNGTVLTAVFTGSPYRYTITANGVLIADTSSSSISSPLTYTIQSNTVSTTYVINLFEIDENDELSSDTATVSTTVINYTPPTVDVKSFYRCDSTGTRKAAGTSVYLEIENTASSPFTLSACYVRTYYLDDIDEVTVDQFNVQGSEAANISRILESSYDEKTKYYLEVRTYDNLDIYTHVEKDLYGSARIINVKDGGTGIALGKLSTVEGLTDSAWDINTDGYYNIENKPVIAGSYNYLINSKPYAHTTTTSEDVKNIWFHSSNTVSYSEVIGEYIETTGNANTQYQIQRYDYRNNVYYGAFDSAQFEVGDGFVIACDIKSYGKLQFAMVWSGQSTSSSSIVTLGNHNSPYELSPYNWTRVYFRGTITSEFKTAITGNPYRSGIYFLITPNIDGQTTYIRNTALFKGNINADWTPNPVDLNKNGYGYGDYNLLTNKPRINNIELTGNVTTDDLFEHLTLVLYCGTSTEVM